ncbi:hypothetical protein Tco_1512098 [Tanacetum coccineum]
MTRSSKTELFTPYKELEREFRSSRKHFKSLSLNELRSYDFNLFSNQEYSEEEEAEELRENMFSSSDNEDANEHIKKVLKIVDLFHLPNITVDHLMLRVFPISLTGAQELDETLYQAWEHFKELLMKCPQHYLTEMQEVILFYNGMDVPTRQVLDSRGVVPTKTVADAKTAIQEMAEYSQKWHNGTSRGRSTETFDGLAAIQAQLSNLGREIKKVNENIYAAQVV